MRTKIQLKDFEPGEFTDIQDRTARETIDLITDFPWQQQRDHIAISLTNPGVTIDGPNNDFLKLAPYYNGKYVLHYLDTQHHLFTRSFDHLEDSFPVIRAFFDPQHFDPASTAFRKENTILQQLTPHFVTNDFHYTLDRRRLISCIVVMSLALLPIVLLGIASIRQPVFAILPLILLILFVGGVRLLFNHYHSAKGNVLIVSKGQDTFAFGPMDNPKKFSKHDIADIVTYGNRGRNKAYGLLAKVQINFTNGSWFELSCLMIKQEKLIAKFPQTKKSEESKIFPFISSDASALYE